MLNIFLYVAIAMLVALLSSRLMRLIKLPNVTGYLITGILIGPFVLGLFFNNFNFSADNNPVYDLVKNLGWISEVALGFIAFTIGSSFKVATLKVLGKRVIVITIFEALGGSLLVLLGLTAAHFIWPAEIGWEIVFTLGAIAAATAPAATLMVIRQYHAHGPLVSTLLPVVALDDAAALMLFAILFSVSKTVATGASFDVKDGLLKPILEIVMSLGIGGILGLLVTLACRFFKSRANRLMVAMVAILAAIGLYHLFQRSELGGFELSSLLCCMMIGAVFVNLRPDASKTFARIDLFTPPVFMLFFILSGANLDLTIFASDSALYVIIIALIYAVFRALGKWLGAFSGSTITRSEPTVRKFLGFTLIPQAGVAIGLATTASSVLTSLGSSSGGMIHAIILTTTLIYELIGPAVTKIALSKAGEIDLDSPVPSVR